MKVERKSPLAYVRPNILRLTPYSTARDEFKGGDISIWVDANESPYNHSVMSGALDVDINRYPDPHQRELKAAISRLKGVETDRIFIGGAGSDEAIDLVYRIFCEPGIDNVVAMSPSYGVYAVAADINNIEYREVPLNDDYSLSVNRLLDGADEHTKVIWICSPNNPTANAFSPDEIESLAQRFDGIVVIDEAYIEFSTKGSMLQRLTDNPNVIVMQTLSKAWGMASLRLGMAFATKEIASLFAMVKYPYNVNGPTQAEVIKQLQRNISQEVNEIRRERDLLAKELESMARVVEVYPSDANFVLVKVDDADAMYNYLIDNGVIVRNRSRVRGCAQCLRITVGTPDENKRLIELLKTY